MNRNAQGKVALQQHPQVVGCHGNQWGKLCRSNPYLWTADCDLVRCLLLLRLLQLTLSKLKMYCWCDFRMWNKAREDLRKYSHRKKVLWLKSNSVLQFNFKPTVLWPVDGQTLDLHLAAWLEATIAFHLGQIRLSSFFKLFEHAYRIFFYQPNSHSH